MPTATTPYMAIHCMTFVYELRGTKDRKNKTRNGSTTSKMSYYRRWSTVYGVGVWVCLRWMPEPVEPERFPQWTKRYWMEILTLNAINGCGASNSYRWMALLPMIHEWNSISELEMNRRWLSSEQRCTLCEWFNWVPNETQLEWSNKNNASNLKILRWKNDCRRMHGTTAYRNSFQRVVMGPDESAAALSGQCTCRLRPLWMP